MQRTLSPLERAKQILMSLQLEESTRFINEEPESPLPQAKVNLKEEVSQEGISVEGPQKSYEENSNIEHSNVVKPMLELDSHNILQGVILSEILGKPVSRRRGRW